MHLAPYRHTKICLLAILLMNMYIYINFVLLFEFLDFCMCTTNCYYKYTVATWKEWNIFALKLYSSWKEYHNFHHFGETQHKLNMFFGGRPTCIGLRMESSLLYWYQCVVKYMYMYATLKKLFFSQQYESESKQ